MRKGRVLCSSDWHGCGVPAKKLLDYLQPEDTLYFLGDAIDREEDGIELMNLLKNRPNTYYIMGNHEKMMLDCIPNIINDIIALGAWEMFGYDADLWFHNGGYKTYSKIADADISIFVEYRKFLSSMPKRMVYDSPKGHKVILEHAGSTPWLVKNQHYDPLWDRAHFTDKFTPNGENLYVVHGHTPVQYLQYEYDYNGKRTEITEKEMEERCNWMSGYDLPADFPKPEVIRYCEGHKFDIDCCTIVSNRIALLDLDTFEVIYFDKE